MPRSVLAIGAPKPAGFYSQGIVHGGVIYVSGQLPIDPARGPVKAGETLPAIEEQVERTLLNVEAVLVAAGSSARSLVRVTVYVSDVALWPRVNAAYEAFLRARGVTMPPARTVVPTGPLHFGYEVEIDAIGVVERD